MRERECQGIVELSDGTKGHAEGCPCVTCKRTSCGRCRLTDKDHITPKAVAKKVWKVKHKVNDRPENKQYLSKRHCHLIKDITTPRRVDLARRQKDGEMITLEDYQRDVLDHRPKVVVVFKK